MTAQHEKQTTNQLMLDLAQARKNRTPTISQVQLAKALGVSTNTVAAWESGKHNPALHHVIAYAEAVGLRLTLEKVS